MWQVFQSSKLEALGLFTTRNDSIAAFLGQKPAFCLRERFYLRWKARFSCAAAVDDGSVRVRDLTRYSHLFPSRSVLRQTRRLDKKNRGNFGHRFRSEEHTSELQSPCNL